MFLTCISNGKIGNPVQLVKRPRRLRGQPKNIPADTWAALMEGVDSLRDRAIMSLLVSSGFRLSELQNLDRDTIHVKRQEPPDGIRVLGLGTTIGKGGKVRIFLVDEATLEILAEYLADRGDDNKCPLFLSNRGVRIGKRNLQNILERWCKRLGLNRLHIHMTRHTYAQSLADSGISSIVLKELMGHSSFTTNQQYFQVNRHQLSASYFAAMERVSRRP
jgi:integrase/recombinase XerC